MIAPKIIDASVAFKWFVPNEKGHENALRVLDDIENYPHLYAVPDLFFTEMLHVLCRYSTDSAQVEAWIADLFDMGWEILHSSNVLLHRAIKLAHKYQVSGYDANYAACAQITGGLWITADAKAHKKIAKLGISKVLEIS